MCYYYPLYKIVNYYYYYYRGAIEFSHSNTYSSLCEKVFYLVLRYYEKKRKEKMKTLTIKLILQTNIVYRLERIIGCKCLGLNTGKHLMFLSIGSSKCSHLKDLTNLDATKCITFSIRFRPTQACGPLPKPKILPLSSALAPSHRSGINSSGLAKTLGSRCAR